MQRRKTKRRKTPTLDGWAVPRRIGRRRRLILRPWRDEEAQRISSTAVLMPPQPCIAMAGALTSSPATVDSSTSTAGSQPRPPRHLQYGHERRSDTCRQPSNQGACDPPCADAVGRGGARAGSRRTHYPGLQLHKQRLLHLGGATNRKIDKAVPREQTGVIGCADPLGPCMPIACRLSTHLDLTACIAHADVDGGGCHAQPLRCCLPALQSEWPAAGKA